MWWSGGHDRAICAGLAKAVLFDLDDTLTAFDAVSDGAWQAALDWFIGRYAPPFGRQALSRAIAEHREWYWSDPERHRAGRADLPRARRDVVRCGLGKIGYRDAAAAHALADFYQQAHTAALHVLPGVKEALCRLRSAGIRMAVITNGAPDGQRGKLDRFGLTDFFSFVLIDMEVGVSKPDSAIFSMALKRLALPARDVWMVGDNLRWDVWGAQRAGIFAVWNDYRGGGRPEGAEILPDMTVTSVAEMVGRMLG